MRKKPNLKAALKNIDGLPDALFGSVDIDLKSLPCLNNTKKEKITARLDSDILQEIKQISKKKRHFLYHFNK